MFYRIEKAKLKCSPVMEKTFIKDEIGRCSSTVSSFSNNYSKALSFALDLLNSIRFLRYLKNLDKFNHDKINKKARQEFKGFN